MKNTVAKTKNTFDGLIDGLDIAEERINELEGISIESSPPPKKKIQREKRMKKSKQNIQAL